ncbi:MAG: hypothetical protein L3J75_17835 [Methylococcaceae bacterium]|nr:hypothetical protein [Methylococcaceae bacterium]
MKSFLKVLFVGIYITSSANSFAGIYSDDLSRCLVESSTPDDKTVLVKWMFTSMSLHPQVKSMSAVTPEDLEKSNKAVAEMFVNLLTVTCKAQAKKAINYEGGLAIQQGFNVFGQVAGKELFSNPEVAKGLSGLEKYMDTEKINSNLGLPVK